MEFDFDTIVVGSGAGGASFAHACATSGKSVLLIERGNRSPEKIKELDEQSTFIDRVPYDDRVMRFNEEQLSLYIGGVLGGGTAVYGGVMLRPSSDDFQPGKHYSTRLPRELWDWPIDYRQLDLHYAEAEQLFRLAVDQQDSYDPLNAPSRSLRNSVLPLAPINQKLIDSNRDQGLRPFRLPLAIDAERCRRCDSCAGFLCPHSARRSTAQIIDETKQSSSLKLMVNAEVERLEVDAAGEVRSVVVLDRQTQQRQQLTARCYALAAGAIGSPAIMLRSKLDGPHVGRNYMMHYSPLAIGLFPKATGANETFVKQVGFADYYFGTKNCPEKMGIVQSLPAPGPMMMAKNGLKWLPHWLLRFLRERMLPLVGIVEDLPRSENRVSLNADQSINVRHAFTAFDKRRGESLSQEMRRVLRRAGAKLCPTRALPSQEHVAHQCGTLRFGNDPKYAALDPNCRVFGHDNLFVVDGSVLPTSLGVGPSLTIAANALRVARVALEAM